MANKNHYTSKKWYISFRGSPEPTQQYCYAIWCDDGRAYWPHATKRGVFSTLMADMKPADTLEYVWLGKQVTQMTYGEAAIALQAAENALDPTQN